VDDERFEKVLRTLRGGATRRGVLAAVAGVAGMQLSEASAKRRRGRKQRRGAAELSAAAAEAAEFQPVTITTAGAIVGGSQSGTFNATGGITDTGTYTFAEDLHRYFTFGGIGAPTFGIVRSVQFFVGADDDDTFDLQNVIKFAVTDQPGVFSVTGTWTVLRGTGAYARLHGQGQITGVIDASVTPETFDFSFTGTVHFA
jgi:hypothetical protein